MVVPRLKLLPALALAPPVTGSKGVRVVWGGGRPRLDDAGQAEVEEVLGRGDGLLWVVEVFESVPSVVSSSVGLRTQQGSIG